MTIDEEDRALFRRAVASIRPVRSESRAAPPRPRRSAVAPRTAADEPAEDLVPGEILTYLKPGADQRILKKLRQGKIHPETQLDLHGCTRREAQALLRLFLQECHEDGVRCALIIHGKGWRSEGFRPVLKSALNQWLRQYPQVIAFCSAKPRHGGSGALYVVLGQNR